MYFEYNELKSQNNHEKHGIDFKRAQLLWSDEKLLEVQLNFPDEVRWLCIGTIQSEQWSAVITYRDNTIRIISVRRSRKKEIEHYENS